MEKYITVYFIGISVFSVLYTIWDKWKAKRGKWRVPERNLIIVSLLGGSLAMYLTMLCIRHKTKHMRFMLGILLIILMQIGIIIVIGSRF